MRCRVWQERGIKMAQAGRQAGGQEGEAVQRARQGRAEQQAAALCGTLNSA